MQPESKLALVLIAIGIILAAIQASPEMLLWGWILGAVGGTVFGAGKAVRREL